MRKWKCSIFVFVLVLFSTGCDGTITREIRHAGFSLSNDSFTCDSLAMDDGDPSNPVWYLDSSMAITEAGDIYELSLNQEYSNQTNCKKSEFSEQVVAILDNRIAKAKDNQLYYLAGSSNTTPYSLVTAIDSSYGIYSLLFQDSTIRKVVTVDQGNGVYYALKTDGNIYQLVISRQSPQSNYQLVSSEIVYSKDTYGKILDFNFSNQSPSITYIRTEKKLYRMQKTNAEECEKYADVECKYSLKEDETLTEYQDKILGYNGSFLITTYGKQFNVNS